MKESWILLPPLLSENCRAAASRILLLDPSRPLRSLQPSENPAAIALLSSKRAMERGQEAKSTRCPCKVIPTASKIEPVRSQACMQAEKDSKHSSS